MTTEVARQREPDGRPLYAYKWHDAYYERLKTTVRTQLPGALRGRATHRFAAMFCVYAAETFRRRHAGGPWTWETVFAEIGYTTPAEQLLYVWVTKGLRHFQRPLLRSHQGKRREFLLTLACEGGLPLRLLHNENAHLSRYFRELLSAYHRERHLPACNATDIARQVAARYLPTFLRHEVVFNLSGDLIRSIVQLQEQVAEATDPLTSLDRAQPAWRDALPLPVEDATVEALLRNLVGQARSLAQTELQRWRWHCILVRQGEHWSIAQHLELPRIVTGTSLYAWSHWNDPLARMRVLLHTTEGIEAIALLTRLQGIGEQATYRCEGLRRGGVRLLGSVAAAGLHLVLTDGDREVEIPTLGGYELGPLPWVFVERGGQWEWYGEGAVRSRDALVQVLTPDEGYFIGDDGVGTPLGKAPELHRKLYEITGTLTWQHSALGACQLRCASEETSEANFLVDGKRLPGVLNLHPPFLGMPSLYAMDRDGRRRRIDGATLEWRPLDAPETSWHTDSAACAGQVWVRYRDPSGALRFRRQVEVVPATTRVAITRIGARTGETGSIRLTGLPAVQVTVPEIAGCHFQPHSIDDGVAIDCAAQASLPITQFRAELQWSAGRPLTLMVPFPRQGAAFVRAGQVLPPRERVALGRLAALQAVVHTPTGGGRFYLEGRLSTSHPGHGRQELRESLRTTSNDPLHFALYRVQERLTAMLAMTGNLDAVVTLDIMDGAGHPLASVDVAQFDVALEPDRVHNLVRLPKSSLERLNDGWEERLTVKMLPLWDPATTPTDLVRDQATNAWRVPEGLAPGPWWVLGWDGDWARCRPLLWPVHGEQTLADGSEFIQIIREPDQAMRQGQLRTLVRALATNMEHPDWPRLFDYLPLTRTYPAGALDLFRHMIHDPEAMVLGLLKSSDEEFDLVWSLAEQLPFSWHLTPVSGWQLAAERYFGALRAGLAGFDPDGGLLWGFFREFRERVTSRQPFFKSVCDWIGRQFFPDRPLENSELAIARHHPAMLTALLQEHELSFQARHETDERYPDGSCVMACIRQPHFPAPWRYEHLAQPFRPVRCAPFAAAQMSLDAEHGSEELLRELRQLRDFDPEWFDNAFAYALCLGLAQAPLGAEGASL